MTEAKVITHSVANEIQLITLQTKAPKFLDAEVEKHKMISSNSSSDRAIPLTKMLEKEYFLPTDVRLNQAGMQGNSKLEQTEEFYEDLHKLYGKISETLLKWKHVHKQHLNRYLLGYSYQNKVLTATKEIWDSFLKLRLHKDADPAMYQLAEAIKNAIDNSTPVSLSEGEWHLPYVTEKGTDIEIALKMSAARCARTSYMKHDNTSPSIEEDLDLYNMLVTRPYTDKRGNTFTTEDPGHWSPLTHQATPIPKTSSTQWPEGVSHIDRNGKMWSANFMGWIQYRKIVE